MKAKLPRLMLQSVLGCLGSLCITFSGAIAQECGRLPEESCGFVATAISNWNTRIESSARVERWSLLDEETGNVDLLISKLDNDDEFRVASVRQKICNQLI